MVSLKRSTKWMDEEYLRKSLARRAILRRRLPWYAPPPPSHAAASFQAPPPLLAYSVNTNQKISDNEGNEENKTRKKRKQNLHLGIYETEIDMKWIRKEKKSITVKINILVILTILPHWSRLFLLLFFSVFFVILVSLFFYWQLL